MTALADVLFAEVADDGRISTLADWAFDYERVLLEPEASDESAYVLRMFAYLVGSCRRRSRPRRASARSRPGLCASGGTPMFG